MKDGDEKERRRTLSAVSYASGSVSSTRASVCVTEGGQIPPVPGTKLVSLPALIQPIDHKCVI